MNLLLVRRKCGLRRVRRVGDRERDIYVARILREAARQVVIVVNGCAIAWIGRFVPLKAFAHGSAGRDRRTCRVIVTIDGVIAGAARDCIIAVVAFDVVIVGAAVDGVVATFTIDGVAACITGDHIIAAVNAGNQFAGWCIVIHFGDVDAGIVATILRVGHDDPADRTGDIDVQVIGRRIHSAVAAIAVSRIGTGHQISILKGQARPARQVNRDRVAVDVKGRDLDQAVIVDVVDIERHIRHRGRKAPAEFTCIAMTVCGRFKRAVAINRITVRHDAGCVQISCANVRLVVAGINGARIGDRDVAGVLGKAIVDLIATDAFPFEILAYGCRLRPAVAEDDVVARAAGQRVISGRGIINGQGRWVVKIHIRDIDARVARGGGGVNEFDPRNWAFDRYVYRIFRTGCIFVTANAFRRIHTEHAIGIDQLNT